jgi:endoplasmic reticulum-Golgi intermediate compartment protein 2
VLDSTGQNVVSFGQLQEENTWFELSPSQKAHFEAAQRLNNRLREEYHSIQQLLWKSGYDRLFGDMPGRYEWRHPTVNYPPFNKDDASFVS